MEKTTAPQLPARIIKLGSKAKDAGTGLSGMVTLLLIELNGNTNYLFQPKGLNPKTGAPVESTWATVERLSGFDTIPTPELPLSILGSHVVDEGSGFAGMAVSLTLHINGCVHVSIQPKGVQEDGSPIKVSDFDIRRLSGNAIKALSEREKAESERKNPSPIHYPARR